MPVYIDYEIRMNLNELIEKRVPCCDLLHPDHCFTESQVTQIAHDINCLLYTSPSPRDPKTSRMPSSA